MSKTIAINAGSSSLKWQLYQMPNEEVIAKGIVERIGLKDSIFTIKYGEGQKYEVIVDIDNHEVAVKMLLDQLIDLNILGSYDEITGVGHRVIEDLKIITCHLGNGASITAVDGGKSVDTSMGFTPLAGVTMGTRSGDVDASLLPYLMTKLGLTDVQDMVDILNKKSGLLGLTNGLSSDMRDIQSNLDKPEVQTAYNIFIDRIRKYIGSYVTVMNGVDAIVFTAGIGENAVGVRKDIIDGMTWFGCEIDDDKNNVHGEEAVISTDDSKIKLLLVPTDEELMIARDVERLK